jgi:PKD repeat protein
VSALRPAALLGLLVAGLALAPPAGATSATMGVTVNSTAGFTQTLAPIPVTVAAAPANIDVHENTTFQTYEPGTINDPHSGIDVEQHGIGGMSFRQLALLSGIPLESLVAPPAAAIVVGGIKLTRDEVTDGFTDPCKTAFACTALPDTLPNFAVIEPDQFEDDFIVLRPLRSSADYNGSDPIQTSVGGVLSVTFNIQGRPLIVGPPGQSATTVPIGGSVTFSPPTSVKFGILEDPNTPLMYSWSFGDGNSATGTAPSDTYTSPGTYSVFVTVTDQQGNRGVSQQITVQVPAPPGVPRPPAFVPFPPPTPKPPTPTPPKPVVPKPVPVAPASHAVVKTAPPLSSAPVHPGLTTSTNAKLRLNSAGGGSGSGGGSGNGTGQGSGSGSATGVAGGNGTSAVGVAVGGSKVAGNPTTQAGQAAKTLPAKRTSGLVGVLIDPSGGIVSLSRAAATAASHAASAARALAGGGRSVGVSWVGWLLGGLAVALVTGGRALVEFEPRAAYRVLRKGSR